MTDYWTANTLNDMIRSFFALLDKVAYWLLGYMYEILFNVASADIFSNATIKNFYGRIQLILGVFMLFKLAISIIQGIISPDSFTDKKSGFGNIITRIVTAIIILAVLTPINIPAAKNEYEIQLNNNGLLFGTLYSLQNRILQNNTLGRLILGTTDNATAPSNDGTLTGADKQASKLKQSSKIFTSTILKGFIRINMKEGKTDETKAADRVCESVDEKTLSKYTAVDADPNQILSLINASCEYQGDTFSDILGTFKRLAGKDRYVFAYMPVISTIVAAIFIWILLGEIINISIRSVKLAVLRIIAPIPVISYVQPSKDGGAFGAWTKALTSTYLELFIHLAAMYFVIFLIQDMIVNGIVINTSGGIVGILSMIFIWIGLFFFMRQAPKFIFSVLGIKNTTANIGTAGLSAGATMLMRGGGLVGFAQGFIGATDDIIQGTNLGKPISSAEISKNYRDLAEQIRTGNPKARARALSNYLDYQTRSRRANQLHISDVDLANADYEKKLAEARARKAQYDLEIAGRAFTTNPTDATARRNYELAYAANEKAKEDLVKRTKAADKIEKDRNALGLEQYVIDKRSKTYRTPLEVDSDSFENSIDPATGNWIDPNDSPGNSWKFAKGTTDNVDAKDLSKKVPSTASDRDSRSTKKDVTDFRK